MQEGAIGGTITAMLAMAERLTPPRRFAEDHAAYLGSLREQASAAIAVDEAVEAEDLPHVHLRMAELNANAAIMLVSISNEFCTLLAPPRSASAGQQDDPTPMLCNGDPLPGGEYGEATIATPRPPSFEPLWRPRRGLRVGRMLQASEHEGFDSPPQSWARLRAKYPTCPRRTPLRSRGAGSSGPGPRRNRGSSRTGRGWPRCRACRCRPSP